MLELTFSGRIVRNVKIVDSPQTRWGPLLGMRAFETGFGRRGESCVSRHGQHMIFGKAAVFGNQSTKHISLDLATNFNTEIRSFSIHDATSNAFETTTWRIGRVGNNASTLSSSHHGHLDHFFQAIQGILALFGEPQMMQQYHSKITTTKNCRSVGCIRNMWNSNSCQYWQL